MSNLIFVFIQLFLVQKNSYALLRFDWLEKSSSVYRYRNNLEYRKGVNIVSFNSIKEIAWGSINIFLHWAFLFSLFVIFGSFHVHMMKESEVEVEGYGNID